MLVTLHSVRVRLCAVQFQEMTGVEYPDLYQDFISIIDVVNMNIGFLLSLACIVSTDYHERLLFATLGPIGILSGMAVLYVVAMKRNAHSLAASRVVKRKFLSLTLFIVFFVHSSVSHTIFQAFMCEAMDDGKTYLMADYTLECTTNRHRGFMAYAALMVIVYPIGIPASFSWWLLRNRHTLSIQTDSSSYSGGLLALKDLWDPYKPHRFYFEIIEYARRIALTGLSVFIYPGSSAQVAIVLLLSVAFALLSEALSPFRNARDAWLYRVGSCITYLSMYLALLLKVDVSDEDSKSQVVFSGVLIVAHVCLMLAIVWESYFVVTEHQQVEPGEVDRSLTGPVSVRFSSGSPGDMCDHARDEGKLSEGRIWNHVHDGQAA